MRFKNLRIYGMQKTSKKSETDLDDTTKLNLNLGNRRFCKDSLLKSEDEVKRFGSDFFKNKNISRISTTFCCNT